MTPPPTGAAAVPRRGEVWRYSPQTAPGATPAATPVLIVSGSGINESTRPWLLAVVVVPESPEDILGVEIPDHGWVHAGVILRVFRPWLTEQLGRPAPAVLDALDDALRSALDL